MVKPIITTVMVCSLFFCFVWAAAGKDKPVLGYTYQRRDGNRYVEGTGGFPNLVHVDVRLDGHPKWIVAAAHEDVVVWIAVMESGDTQTFMTRGGSVTPVDTATSLRAGSKPPLLVTTKGRPRLLESPDGTFTQGLLLPKSGQTVGLSGRNMIVMNDNRTHL